MGSLEDQNDSSSYSYGFTSTTGHAAVLADGFVELNVSWFDLYLNDFCL